VTAAPPTADRGDIASAWSARARELADWALARFFVRTDRYGGYYIKDGQTEKVWRPQSATAGVVNAGLLARHFAASRTEHVVGPACLTAGESVGRVSSADIDAHDDDADSDQNEQYGRHLYSKLASIGFQPILATWGGSLHVHALFSRDVQGVISHAFGQWMVSDASEFGFASPVESFPKQSHVPAGKYGNWLRLVGRHHTRDVWAKVFDGKSWLEGAAAVAHLLTLTGDSPDLIPAEARPTPPPRTTPSASGASRNSDGHKHDDVFPAWLATVTLDNVVSWLEVAGHTAIRRTADRVDFTRAGKKPGGGSFNVKVIDGTPITYSFSTNAGLPDGEGLNPSQLRCFLAHGSTDTSAMNKLSETLKEEMGWSASKGRASASDRTTEKKKGDKVTEPLPLVYYSDVRAALDTADFVEGLLIDGAMSVIYGESGCGKTFFALDLALHIAAGLPWRGREVERRGVLYLALEGSRGIRNRIAAFKSTASEADLPLAYVPVAMNLLSPDGDTLRVVEAARAAAAHLAIPVGFIVVDTLSRAIAGGNENASEDMGALVRNIDLIRQALPSHVAAVHHSGKDTAKGARGHSLLRAATDTEIEVSRDPLTKVSVARVTKQRELELGDEFAFRLSPVELGKNRRGKPVTSCVVCAADNPAVEAQDDRRTQKQQERERIKKEFERKKQESDDAEVVRVIRVEVAKGLPGASRTLICRDVFCSDARADGAIERLLEGGVLVEIGPFERPSGYGAPSKIKAGYGLVPTAGTDAE
jgi:hypothetical protein